MEQKIIRVEATCSTPIEEKVDQTIKEMNKSGFRLIDMCHIPANERIGKDPYGHWFGDPAKRELLFEKL